MFLQCSNVIRKFVKPRHGNGGLSILHILLFPYLLFFFNVKFSVSCYIVLPPSFPSW